MEPGWSNAYLGVPFVDNGRDREGWDCWGLLRVVYRDEFGIELPSYDEGYESAADSGSIADLFEAERCDWIEVVDPDPGDAVMLRICAMPCHVGVMVTAGSFLHVMERRGTCLERLSSPTWRSRVLAYYRHRHRLRSPS